MTEMNTKISLLLKKNFQLAGSEVSDSLWVKLFTHKKHRSKKKQNKTNSNCSNHNVEQNRW